MDDGSIRTIRPPYGFPDIRRASVLKVRGSPEAAKGHLKPHIDNLVGKALDRNRDSPAGRMGDADVCQSIRDHRITQGEDARRHGGHPNVFGQLAGEGAHPEVEALDRTDDDGLTGSAVPR